MAAALAALFLLAGADAAAAGPLGQRVFESRCASCHALGAQAMPAAGPQLAGLIGRRLAGDPAFDYSPALRAARARGDLWDAATLERFLADPEALYPGLWMGENGVDDATQRAALVAFLASLAR